MPGAVNLLLRQQSAGEARFFKNGVMRVSQRTLDAVLLSPRRAAALAGNSSRLAAIL